MWGGIRSSHGPAEVGPTVRARQPPLPGALVHVALCSCASVLLQGTQVFRSPLSTLHQKVLVPKNQCRRSGQVMFVPRRQLLSWASGHLPAPRMEVRR